MGKPRRPVVVEVKPIIVSPRLADEARAVPPPPEAPSALLAPPVALPAPRVRLEPSRATVEPSRTPPSGNLLVDFLRLSGPVRDLAHATKLVRALTTKERAEFDRAWKAWRLAAVPKPSVASARPVRLLAAGRRRSELRAAREKLGAPVGDDFASLSRKVFPRREKLVKK